MNDWLHNLRLNAFSQGGWLLIAFFPTAQAIQRTPFTLMSICYLTWALVSLAKIRTELTLKSPWLFAYLGFILALAGNLWVAQYPLIAVTKWLQYLAYSAVFPLVWLILQRLDHFNRLATIQQLSRYLAWSTAIIWGILWLKLAWFYYGSGDFQPRYQLEERLMPFLLPFLLYETSCLSTPQQRWFIGSLLYVSGFIYIIISQGRTALLAYTVATGCYFLWVNPRRYYQVGFIIVILLGLGIAASGHYFFRDTNPEQQNPAHKGLAHLDQFTSNRTILWRQAWQHPPDNPWLGWGMGHGRYHLEVLQVEINGIIDQNKHLHNFILDTAYETGWLGLCALLGFISSILIQGIAQWRKTAPLQQKQLGLYLTSSIVILLSALLDTAYDNKLFNLYLFLMLAVITQLKKA